MSSNLSGPFKNFSFLKLFNFVFGGCFFLFYFFVKQCKIWKFLSSESILNTMFLLTTLILTGVPYHLNQDAIKIACFKPGAIHHWKLSIYRYLFVTCMSLYDHLCIFLNCVNSGNLHIFFYYNRKFSLFFVRFTQSVHSSGILYRGTRYTVHFLHSHKWVINIFLLHVIHCIFKKLN